MPYFPSPMNSTDSLLMIIVGLLTFSLAYVSTRLNGSRDRLTLILAGYGVLFFIAGNIGFLYQLLFK